MKIILKDSDVQLLWGLSAEEQAGEAYPERVCLRQDPSEIQDSGIPIFGNPLCDLEPGDPGYDDRIADGNDMEYLRTEIESSVIRKHVQQAAEVAAFVSAWVAVELRTPPGPDNIFAFTAAIVEAVEEIGNQEIELVPFCEQISNEIIRLITNAGDADIACIPFEPLRMWCPQAFEYVGEQTGHRFYYNVISGGIESGSLSGPHYNLQQMELCMKDNIDPNLSIEDDLVQTFEFTKAGKPVSEDILPREEVARILGKEWSE